ncbi:hypothetical protein RUM43_003817 [Polyplax serrata]|uniref:Uncharacterized protein n=1 Tax=Polyplax serrata TaxID=468196 RepID=A0AAN8PHT9_POLSC
MNERMTAHDDFVATTKEITRVPGGGRGGVDHVVPSTLIPPLRIPIGIEGTTDDLLNAYGSTPSFRNIRSHWSGGLSRYLLTTQEKEERDDDLLKVSWRIV